MDMLRVPMLSGFVDTIDASPLIHRYVFQPFRCSVGNEILLFLMRGLYLSWTLSILTSCSLSIYLLRQTS